MIARHRNLGTTLLLATTLFTLYAGCAEQRRERPSVLLIIVDTLRADRLSGTGEYRELAPHLQAWMQDAQVFTSAFAHAPWTLPSTASLFTSTYPQQHGAGGVVPHRNAQGEFQGGFRALGPGLPTLAERFQVAGYDTAAIVNVDFLSAKFGLTRGFEHVDEVYYTDNERVRDARQTTDAALQWLSQHTDGPNFLLVHYFDVHAVYTPPAEFRSVHALPQDRDQDQFRFPSREQMVALRQGTLALDEETIARAEALYNGEVAFVDREIGRLLEGLRQQKLVERTIVALTSDHGEEFLEHGGFEHGHTLYDELLHVPLAIAWPGVVPAGKSDSLVGLIDVAPTLCELADVAAPPTFLGQSLVPLWSGSELSTRTLLAHGNFWGPALSSLRQEENKLILGPELPGRPRVQALFDWRQDPGERSNRAAHAPDLCNTLRGRLLETERILEAHQGTAVELDPDTRERLKAAGYIGGDE